MSNDTQQPSEGQPPPFIAPPKCFKCGAATEAGFVIDTGYVHLGQARWCPARTDAGKWTDFGLVTRAQVKQSIPVSTFRCPRCGYLESYAPDPI